MTMQYNVAQLLMEPIGSTRTYEMVEQIDDLDDELEPLGPLVGSVHFLRIPSGVLVTGELSTAMQVSCNRCLFPIALPVRFEIEESFRPLTEVATGRYIRPDEFQGEDDDLEDPALLINEQHILDLSEVIRQNIWVAMPMVPGCNWEGAGQCPNLQQHLSELSGLALGPGDKEQAEIPDEIDPRWAALLQLRGDDDDSNS
ncbi:MAG: DUF177 domain-containing protein [Caldilineaceae bacterium]|nr:DUF177 domain-containing protein [Caldilineaceae bacterium]